MLLGSEPLQGSHLSIPSTTRSFLSSVAVPVAPFELQPAPSTLQRKLLIPKPTPRPILTQVLQGNPQEGQVVPIPATPSVDRRRIQEWGARV
ncbi:hypothetical protein F5876DRAFT_85037 [Lentinula aff. lateritia]|uniref:Uncharacterized protein n=1 Tax=Lentinula aff. lateritia TaxID=2804960 RepID=A0ACC1TFZ7_9AGAR|nr:hypothetical protein F5876DRAFT_85037 [Lentinula aff. lateritia]